MRRDRVCLLGVPADSVGDGGGAERGPEALRRQLSPGFSDSGDTRSRLRGGVRDPQSGWKDLDQAVRMSATSGEAADMATAVILEMAPPVLLGGGRTSARYPAQEC